MKNNNNNKNISIVISMLALAFSTSEAVALDTFDPSNIQLLVKNHAYNFLEKNNIKPELSTLTTDLMGDKIDYFSGGISFEHTDISIPGNFDIPVQISRVLAGPDNWNRDTQEFGNWSLNLPKIKSTYITSKSGDYKTAYWPNGKACTENLNSNPRFTNIGNNGENQAVSYSAANQSYWGGDTLSIPGKGTVKFTERENDQTNKRYNNKNWPVDCFTTSKGHDGFIVTTDDGTKYTFAQQKTIKSLKYFNLSPASSVVCNATSCSAEALTPSDPNPSLQYPMYHAFMLVTEVKDIHGNWVKYQYHDNGNLKRIYASDNREITLEYTNDVISKITANEKSYIYQYDNSGIQTLGTVKLPDNSMWHFDYIKNEEQLSQSPYNGIPIWHPQYQTFSFQAPVGGVGCIPRPSQRYISITHPQGTSGEFIISGICQGSANIPKLRRFNVQRSYYDTHHIEPEIPITALVSKSIALKDGTQYSWNYEFSENKGYFKGEPPAGNYYIRDNILSSATRFDTDIDNLKTEDFSRTIVTFPDNSQKMMYFNRRHGHGYGNMTHDIVYTPSGTKLQTVKYTYENGVDHGSTNEFLKVSGPDDFVFDDIYTGWSGSRQQRKTSVVTIHHDLTDSTYANYFSSFNQYDVPRVTHQQGPSGSRYSKLEFSHDTTRNLLNLPLKYFLSADKNYTSPYMEFSYKTGTNLVQQEKLFGQLIKTNTYHGDGNLKKSTYAGTNRYEQFEDYYRGRPRQFTQPCAETNGCDTTNGSTANTLKTMLEINSDGTTKSVTDFNGHKTSYGYNPVGWLTSVDYADTKWTDKTIQYGYVSTVNDGISNSGISLGSLRQKITQGNYTKDIYHDSLLRPIFTQEQDKSVVSTKRYQMFEYDYNGKTSHASFVSQNPSNRIGTSIEYDALGRKTKVTRTSDNAISKTSYSAGHVMSVTDPQNNTTTTTFLAYGSPSNKKPLHIVAPDSEDTRLAYNLFEQVTHISQGDITETRVYDEKQLLCKTIRPETGITAFDYNVQRQPIWQAAGIAGSTEMCMSNLVNENNRVTTEYNNLGVIKSVDYPDDTPDTRYRYDNNGNVLQLQADNVVWNYQYNSQNLIEKETLAVDDKTFVLDWSYNNMGHVSQLIYPSGSQVNFAPNALGQATQAAPYATSVMYHPNGQVKQLTYGNGIVRKLALDTTGRIDSITDKKQATLLSLDPSYDSNDNLSNLIDDVDASNNITNLRYDGVNRLLSADGRWGLGSYDYDGLGNILSRTISGLTVNYHYDSFTNRLSHLSNGYDYQYQYDNRGNVIDNGRYALDYNLGQQMTAAKDINYQYDGYNRRVRKTQDGKSSYTVYSQAGKLLYRLSETNQRTESVYLGNTIVAEIDRK